MHCSACGKGIKDGDKYCSNCGAAQDKFNELPETNEPQEVQEHKAGWSWRRNWWIVALPIIIVLKLVIHNVSNNLESSNSIKGAFTDQQICIAGIARTMGRPPSIIKVSSIKGAITYLYYYRPDDGTRWAYRCKLDGNKVIWAGAEASDRWRVHKYDSKITFTVSGNTIKISERYADGSGGDETYNINELGG